MTSKNASNKKNTQKQRAKRPNYTPAVLIGGGVLLLVVVVVLYFVSQQTVGAIEGLEQYTVQQGHQTGKLTYAQIPPVGGVHNPSWQNCGVYDQPIDNEYGVHSMEHGAIWITYQPDLPSAEVEKLKTITHQSGYRLLSPYPDLPTPVVVSAWGYQVKLQSADDPRLMLFIQKYQQNPRGPEPGAPCTGGQGQPG